MQEVSSENTINELDNLKQIDCQVGAGQVVNGECKIAVCNYLCTKNDTYSTGAKTAHKRKTRSTRRRLNAMINNTSIHFSDTDSEGELLVTRVATPNHIVKVPTSLKPFNDGNNLLHPIISVTADGSDDSSYGDERYNSFLGNHTDVDEIYTTEPEDNDASERSNTGGVTKESLSVSEVSYQGETDLEEVSNDEEGVVQSLIYVKARSDILCDFNGEIITTKEGDGPFSIEIRNQMFVDEAKPAADTPDIVVVPTTDTEDMEASDEDEEVEGACGICEAYEDFDILAASQIIMKNVNKMEQLLTIQEPEDGISDNHTDFEDLE